MLRLQRSLMGCAMARSTASFFICSMAYDMAVPCTIWCPSRVMADLRSVSGLPEALNAAELATCRMRAARRGSAPTMVTT